MIEPILITGCARSGTSLIAGIINLCGAFGGNMSGSNRNNRKGMFENMAIRNNILKPLLSQLGYDRLGQYPLPDINKLPNINLRYKIMDIFKNEGYQKGPWMYKGAKMCLIWPIFQRSFYHAKWVIVRRRTDDIIDSCIKTSFMHAFNKKENQKAVNVNSQREGWLWWVKQHLKRFEEMEKTGLNIKYVWPEKMIENGNYQEIKDVIKWLGLKWDNDVFDFVTPGLWNTANKKG